MFTNISCNKEAYSLFSSNKLHPYSDFDVLIVYVDSPMQWEGRETRVSETEQIVIEYNGFKHMAYDE